MKFLLPGFLFILTLNSYAQTGGENKKIENSVIEFFEGLSNGDMERLKKYSTGNIKLIENGQVWTMDTLAKFTSVKRAEDYRRVNTLKFIETEIKGNIAWTSYYNRADITSNGRSVVRKWMESIVLIKEDDEWKVRLLHSTPEKQAF
jgi:hypothetical protein